MGADERVFSPQLKEFPNLTVPDWIEPEPGESLPSYAKRFAKAIDPGEPCIIGGASFGGMVATEMMPHLNAKACILIGSVRHPEQLPPVLRWVRPLEKVTELIPITLMQIFTKAFVRVFRPWISAHNRTILHQAQNSDSPFFHWALRALIRWQKNSEAKPDNFFHIHGECDPLLPLKYVYPDKIVENGWHVISLRNGETVNRFIRESIGKAS